MNGETDEMDSIACGDDAAGAYVVARGEGAEDVSKHTGKGEDVCEWKEEYISERIGKGVAAGNEQNVEEGEDEEDEGKEESSFANSDNSDRPNYRFIPTGRPIAEPPMFDYDTFIDKKVPSKKRLEALFPEIRDIDKRTTIGDTSTEIDLLLMHKNWVYDTLQHPKCVKDEVFYEGLSQELRYDINQVLGEWEDAWDMAPSGLGKWKFLYLDQDGKTTQIQADRKKGIDFFSYAIGRTEAWVKYKHLAPAGYTPRFPKTGLERWESKWLHQDGDTRRIKRYLKKYGDDIFIGREGGGDAWQKYKHSAKPSNTNSGCGRCS